VTYAHVMIPIDLEHADRMGKAIDTARALAGQFGAKLTFVGITGEAPGTAAHNPAEFRKKMEAFAQRHAADLPHGAVARTYVAHDPAAQIDGILLEAVREIGADLVVMASHRPRLMDAIWPSHGGRLASHAPVSVFVVR
jgi:nucleotide-binding universal stress UspA family protein